MAEWLKQRTKIEKEEFFHDYTLAKDPGRGWGFPCDKDGVYNKHLWSKDAVKNLNDCLIGVKAGTIIDHGVIRDAWEVTEPGVIECAHCHKPVSMNHAFINSCSCGADYDGNGNLLAPRSQWGEETGETASDILINAPDPDDLFW